jgi:hypothetical protein
MSDRARTERVMPKRRPAGEEVGYGKPPREHTWQPGHSGNPKGRAKGSKNESTILKEVMQQKIAMRGSNGRTRKITVLEGIHRKQAEQALQGSVKSAAFVLNRYGALVSGELQPQDLSEDDRAVLEAFAQQIAARGAGESP